MKLKFSMKRIHLNLINDEVKIKLLGFKCLPNKILTILFKFLEISLKLREEKE